MKTKAPIILLLLALAVGGWYFYSLKNTAITLPSNSMTPTIPMGKTVNVDRLAYSSATPNRFDIVVFTPPDSKDIFYVSRVIGLPGDRIELSRKGLSINGTILTETAGVDYKKFSQDIRPRLTDNEYYVIGDFFDNSNDSRSFGPITIENIQAKVNLDKK